MRATITRGTTDPNHARALTFLRWAAIAGQLVTIPIAEHVFQLGFPPVPLYTVVAIEIVVSIVCEFLLRRGFAFRPIHLRLLLLFDISALGVLLYNSGGVENPFSFLFLVHIVLAAMVLGRRDAWATTLLSTLFFGALFAFGPREHNHQLMEVHLQGMWVAFVIAAALIVTLVTRVLKQLEERQNELALARERASRAETVSKLGMLAAGAAHELATPLATIRLIANDLRQRSLEAAEAGMTADAEALSEQVERCRSILEVMAGDAGATYGNLRESRVSDIVDQALDRLSNRQIVSVQYEGDTLDQTLQISPGGFGRALASVLQNAIDATSEQGRVELTVSRNGNEIIFRVVDDGTGIPSDILDSIKDPFFTTKEAGRGLGLGLFFAETVVSELGGRLSIENRPSSRGVIAEAIIPQIALGAPS